MKRSLFAVLGSLCVVTTALATTYVRVEKDGTKTYSDRPLPGGKEVEVQPAQTYSAPPSSSSSSGLSREQQLVQQFDSFKYQSCGVTPPNDSTFNNPESVSIALATVPALRGEDTPTMLVDGQPVPGYSAIFTMAPVYRGTHTVSVTIKNPMGQVMCSSTSVFHVTRPGLNSPVNRARN